MGLHARAVQYLAQKWYGSHTEMFAFAESVAAAASEGSPLHCLPLHAVTEYALEHEAGIGKGPIAWSRIEGFVEAGLELSARFEPGDRRAAGFRNHLALALIRSDREVEHMTEQKATSTQPMIATMSTLVTVKLVVVVPEKYPVD